MLKPFAFHCFVNIVFQISKSILLNSSSGRKARFNQRRGFLRPLNLFGTPDMGMNLWGDVRFGREDPYT